jgi:phage protein U
MGGFMINASERIVGRSGRGVLLGLGDYKFSISTAAYDSLSRSTSWRWPSQERAGRTPARQFTGKGDDTITLTGVIFAEQGGVGQVEALRKLADTGEPQILVDQLGYIRGKWCIETITETQSSFFSDGVARKQEFSIQMSAYGEDDA